MFESERLYVAKWKAEDLDSLYQLFSNEGIKQFIVPRLTIEETEHIFLEQLKNYDHHFPFGRYFIVEKKSNECIGLLLFKDDKDIEGVEIGYSFKKEVWRRGYATEIVQASIHFLNCQKKFSDLYGITEAYNINSQHVLLKCGFCRQQNFIENGREMNLFHLKLDAFHPFV